MGWTIGTLTNDVATAAELEPGLSVGERPTGPGGGGTGLDDGSPGGGDGTGDGSGDDTGGGGTGDDDPFSDEALGIGGDTDAEPFDPVGSSQYSADRPGYHNYTTGANLVCPAALRCSRQEMIEYLHRYAWPGQNPVIPVNDGDINTVSDPRPSIFSAVKPGGDVITHVSPDGLTIVNRTLEGHVFHDGMITRQLSQVDGNWYVTTTGVGNNERYLVLSADRMASINSSEGTDMFTYIDGLMADNIEAHH